MVGPASKSHSRVPTKYLDEICSEGMSDNNNQNNKLGQKLTLVDSQRQGLCETHIFRAFFANPSYDVLLRYSAGTQWDRSRTSSAHRIAAVLRARVLNALRPLVLHKASGRSRTKVEATSPLAAP